MFVFYVMTEEKVHPVYRHDSCSVNPPHLVHLHYPF